MAAGALVGGWWFLRVGPGAPGCSGSATLTIAASPAVAEPLRQLADAYREVNAGARGECASVRVTSIDGGRAASFLRGGWTDPEAGEIPDIWMPDSEHWLTLARTTEPANRLLPDPGTVVATSPVVIAMPRPMAQKLGWPGRQVSWADLRGYLGTAGYWASRGQAVWGDFALGLPDPRTSVAGLAALTNIVATTLNVPAGELTERAITDGLTAKGAVLRLERASSLITESESSVLTTLRTTKLDDAAGTRMSAVPLSESLVFQYNQNVGLGAGPRVGAGPDLAAFYPRDGLTLAEVRYVRLGRDRADGPADAVKTRMARDLLALIQSERGRAILAAHGFRGPDGSAEPGRFGPDNGLVERPAAANRPALTSPVLTALQGAFRSVHQVGNTLTVLDSSGSMAEEVPGSGGRSRLTVALDAARAAIPLFADDSHLGLWHFSARVRGDLDWEELVPIGPMDGKVGTVPRPQALLDSVGRIEPKGATGLYDTVLAAFRHMKQNYVEGRPNQVVLLTDGSNSDPGSLTLDELVRTLRHENSAQYPIRMITIGYGEDADLDALARISAATGAQSYPALDPNGIFAVFVGALSQIPT